MIRFIVSTLFLASVFALIFVEGPDNSGRRSPPSDSPYQLIAREAPNGRACQLAVLMLIDGSPRQAPVQVPRRLSGQWVEVFAPGVLEVVEDESTADREMHLIYDVEYEDAETSSQSTTRFVDVSVRSRWSHQTIRFGFRHTAELGLEIRTVDPIFDGIE